MKKPLWTFLRIMGCLVNTNNHVSGVTGLRPKSLSFLPGISNDRLYKSINQELKYASKCYIIPTVSVSDVIRSNIFLTFLTANIYGMTIISSWMEFICHLVLLLAYRISHQLLAPGL